MKNFLLNILISMTLLGCTTYSPLKAPCTYDSRHACGGVIPMQQTAD